MKLPDTPFTMYEFEQLNELSNLGMKHYREIHKRFKQLGLVRVRRRRDKDFAEDVWVRNNQFQDPAELRERLKALRA